MNEDLRLRRVPDSQLPNAGAFPDRGTPEAVVHLVRLARMRLTLDSQDLSMRLYTLATMLNDRLPVERQIGPDDARLNEPYSGETRAIAEWAQITMGAYVVNPAIQPAVDARKKAFVSLARYFTWCHGMWEAVDASRSSVDAFRFDHETMNPLDDIGEHSLGIVLHWLASLCVVIEGWHELELADSEIDQKLAEGGSAKDEGSLAHRLQRLRNGVFHFQREGTDSSKFKEFWTTESGVLAWAISLESAFRRFFRRTHERQHADLDEWLHRGLEPKFDPDLTSRRTGG